MDCRRLSVSLRLRLTRLQLKLPNSVGQKKVKAIEQVLDELNVDLNPIPTEDVITNYNELRQDIVLMYELKLALANCEYELQTLKHQLETLAPDRVGVRLIVGKARLRY